MRHIVLAIAFALSVSPHSPAESPVSPTDSVALIQTAPGVRVELIAAEPQVFDPVAMAFDEQGRLFVVENRGYPSDTGNLGTVALLTDADADGYYETRTVFAEGFDIPNGIMPWRGGVLLTCAPDVYFLKDTDGDGKADVREVMLTGFALGGSTQLRVSHPTLGLDNWIYFTSGLSGGKVSAADDSDAAPVDMGATDLRYDPIHGTIEPTAGRGQFGLAFDDYGRKFVCSNRKHIEQVVLQPTDLARNPYLNFTQTVADIPDHGGAARIFALSDARTTAYAHAGTFTAACGLTIYRGSALPADFYGNSFVCEPTAALVHRDVLQSDGATLVARRGREGVEFLASTDNWFRPVFLTNGPDGALYLCDMYRETIEHPTYLPPEVAAVTDFYQGNDRGRIYRITGGPMETATPSLDASKVGDLDAAGLVSLLDHADSWMRDTAHRLLLERQDTELAEPLREALFYSKSEFARLHAMYLLDGSGTLHVNDLQRILNNSSARIREHAVRLARTHPEWFAETREAILALAGHHDAGVRLASALALGDVDHPQKHAALARLGRRDMADPWARAAVLSSIGTATGSFTNVFLEGAPAEEPGMAEMMESLGRMAASSSTPAETAEVLSKILGDAPSNGFGWRAAALNGVGLGVRRSKAYTGSGTPLQRLVAAIPETQRSEIGQRIDGILDHAVNVAVDTRSEPQSRLASVKLLGHADYEIGGEALARLLSPLAPRDLQVAAVQSLSNMDDPRVATQLTDADTWTSFMPAVRTAASSALMANTARVQQFLSALEEDAIAPWSVAPATRNRLKNHKDPALRARARAIFESVTTTDRSAIYEEYKSVLTLAPQRENGREVFRNLCSSCHLFDNIGHEVGPDLTGISSQPIESILLHILAPNSLMLEGYESYFVETHSGESFSGIIVAENASSITVRQGLGIEETIARTDIERIETTGMSMMPDELETGMTRQELRDLIGFLKGERPATSN